MKMRKGKVDFSRAKSCPSRLIEIGGGTLVIQVMLPLFETEKRWLLRNSPVNWRVAAVALQNKMFKAVWSEKQSLVAGISHQDGSAGKVPTPHTPYA